MSISTFMAPDPNTRRPTTGNMQRHAVPKNGTTVSRMPLYFTFVITLFIVTISRAGQVLLALYALKLGAQPFTIGVIAATYSVSPMLLSWQAGRLADRFGSRWLLLGGSVGGACGMMVPYYLPGLPAIYSATMLNGLMHAFTDVCVQSLVGLLSNPDNRSRNFSNFSLVVSVAGFIGPLISGFSIDLSGHAAACLYLVILLLLPIAMLTIGGGSLSRGSRTTQRTGSVRELLENAGLWKVLIISSLVVTGIDLFQFYMPIYGNDIGLSASAIGVVLSMYSVSAFVVRMIIPSLIARSNEKTVLACSFFIGALSLVMVPFFGSAVVLSLVSLAFGFGMGCGQPITMMMTYTSSAEGRSGEAMGLRLTVNHLTRVIVPLLFGLIGSAFGMYPVFFVNALMLASGGVITRPGTMDSKRTGHESVTEGSSHRQEKTHTQ